MKLSPNRDRGNNNPSASDLAARLAQCRADWLPCYFRAGKLAGSMFHLGDADGAPGRSFPIPLRGQPHLVDFGGDFRGDDLDLLARAICGDLKAAYTEALAFLGIAGKVTPRPARPVPAPSTAASSAADNRELAQEIWRQTVRIRRDRLALDYLVCRRGLTSWDDDRIRWHPACPWGNERVGCIVAPVVCHRTGCTVAIWRIRPVMAGTVERMGLGPTKGNCSPVCVATGDQLAICEGVEDAIAFHLLEGVPCWAALSARNMADLILPDRLRRVLICQDNDAPGRDGRRPGPEAAQALRRRLQAEGRSARIIAATNAKDANDALRKAVQ